MKKLNRKGFTLVELLAVIVILAIVVGITLVTVLPTLKDSRQKAFELTAQTAADFVEKQYQLSLIGQNTTLTSFGTLNGTTYEPELFTTTTITAAGLKPENYVAGTYYINQNTGRACVKLYASTNEIISNVYNLASDREKKAGEYYDANVNVNTGSSEKVSILVYVNKTGSPEKKDYKYSMAQSSGC